METSDSEYFESADEEFDDETKSTSLKEEPEVKSSNLKTNTAEVAAKIENISISSIKDDAIKTSTSSEIKSNKDNSNIETNKAERAQRREQRTKKEPKPKLGTKLSQRIESKVDKEESESSRIETECKEPSMNYEKESHSSKSVTAPKREVCWEPGVDYIDNSKGSNKAKLGLYVPSEEEDGWQPECDDSDLEWNKKKSIEQKIQEAVKDELEENLWGTEDDWETVPNTATVSEKAVADDENKSSNSSGWGNWGNWGGVSSILSTATQGVTTLTNHVSQGLTTVLETGIGVPEPEELARMHKNQENTEPNEENIEDINPEPTLQSVFGLGNLVSGVSHITKLVESTSNKVLTGGLDTLEVIGKKTMEVLQEGDPGLKKKRAFLKINQNKPVLSQLLREAKEKAEEENKLLEERHFQKKANYETLFDDNQGLVHLEALEMLSKQCDIKLETIMSTYNEEQMKEMQETMNQIKELCEITEDEEDETLTNKEIEEKLRNSVDDLNIPINYDKLLSLWLETDEWLSCSKINVCNEREIHQQAIETLAHLTALSVEQYHKAGELLLVKEHRSTADEADSLVQLTTTLTALIGIVASKFSEKLNVMASKARDPKIINELITNVFLESANSSSYIRDAFELLIPVLQVGAI